MRLIFPFPSLFVATNLVISLFICYDGGNASPTAALGASAAAAGEATVAKEQWTSLTMDLDDGAIRKNVLIRDGADEAEVLLLFTKPSSTASFVVVAVHLYLRHTVIMLY